MHVSLKIILTKILFVFFIFCIDKIVIRIIIIHITIIHIIVYKNIRNNTQKGVISCSQMIKKELFIV